MKVGAAFLLGGVIGMSAGLAAVRGVVILVALLAGAVYLAVTERP